MGNRAILAFEDAGVRNHDSVGIYLHWNGGRDSVEGFLLAAKCYGLRSGDYGIARLTQIIGNFIGGTLSLGVGVVGRMDNSDNGIYWISDHFEITGREIVGTAEDLEAILAPDGEQSMYPLSDMVDEVRQKNDYYFINVRGNRINSTLDKC